VSSMWKSVSKLIVSPLAIRALPVVIVVMIGGYLSFRYNMILKDNRDLVIHTHQVISAVERVFSLIQDAETGQRGYVITGDEKYLDPYANALRAIPEELREVRVLVPDRLDQQDRLSALEAVLQNKLNELNDTIALRRNEGFDAARSAIVRAEGKASMDRIRLLVTQMIAVEKVLLADRTSKVERDERRILWVALSLAAASIASRIIVAFAIRRHAARRLRTRPFVIPQREG
jgi:CHASE3 domain sensor protein